MGQKRKHRTSICGDANSLAVYMEQTITMPMPRQSVASKASMSPRFTRAARFATYRLMSLTASSSL